ncbi:MAG: beta-L-arabinofuranosidase domain-containing protein [Bacteroidota bacterium]
MKSSSLIFSAVILCISSLQAGTQNNSKALEQPASVASNTYYTGNRAPLQPSAYIKLPVTSIKPEGWLKEYLFRQRDGLTGNLGKISAWLQKKDNAWLSKTGEGAWGFEEVPYWIKGYGNLAYILNDPAMIAETKIWIEGALNSQRPDGNFGPQLVDGDFGIDKSTKVGKPDFWSNMIMLYCLQSYYEYSGDNRVLTLMTNYFKFELAVPEENFLKGYWQGLRGGDNLHSVLWLYNITGDQFLLELAEKLHRCTTSWITRNTETHRHNHPQKDNPEWYKLLCDWHNVNVAQGFREPATYFQLSKNPSDKQASYDVFNIIRKHFGQVPGGMFGSDEVARPGYDDPHQGVETCGLVEQMNSDEHLLRITGDLLWADHAENVAFNMYPAAVTPDFKALHYLTAPNMVVCDDKNHAPGVKNGGPYLMFNPFSSRCCQHNHAQGWPYYLENLWMAAPDNGAFVALYAASEATIKVGDGTQVSFKEQTNYPFDEKVLITLAMNKAVVFPLYLRIPGWCKKASVKVNGKAVDTSIEAGKVSIVNRNWMNGDKVEVNFPMEITVTRWTGNHNAASVNYGPLTFSLKIKENNVKKESDKTAIYDSKWQDGVDTSKWPSWEILPASDWNYGLVLNANNPAKSFKVIKKGWPKSNFPFTIDETPIVIKAKARQIPEWQLDQHLLCGVLMDSPVVSTQPEVEVELIPMGAARLRISAFPVIK